MNHISIHLYKAFYGSSRPSSISVVDIFFLFTLENKNKKIFADFIKIFRGFSKFNDSRILLEAKF